MITLIERKSADGVWRATIEKFQEDRSARVQTSREGNIREMLHSVFTITNPRQRWVVSRNPPINPALAIAEVISIMNGRQDSTYSLPWHHQLRRDTVNIDDSYGAYGYRLRKNLGLDQLERAYQVLLGNPESQEVVMQIWDSKLDMPNADGSPKGAEAPSNVACLLKIRDDRLEWTQVLRSSHLFFSTPYSFIQFTTMQEIMAGWLGVELGHYHHLTDSLYFYEKDFNFVSSRDAIGNVVEEENMDSLGLPKSESGPVLKELENSIEIMASEDLSPKNLELIVGRENLPAAYQNLRLLMASESARRRGWDDLIEAIMWECTNPILIQSWLRWLSYFRENNQLGGPKGQSDS